MQIWDASSRDPIGIPLKGLLNGVRSVGFSPNGKQVVSASDDNTVRIWDVEMAVSAELPLKGRTDFMRSIAFSLDGERIISGSDDTTLIIWDALTATPVGPPWWDIPAR